MRLWWVVWLILLPSVADAGWDPLQKARRAAQEGQRNLAAGDSMAAVESLLRAQALDPDDARIGLGLAETLFRTGQYKSSMGQYRSLADPTDPEREQAALYNAGNAAFAAQDLEAALDLYTRALVREEGEPDPDLLHNLELTQQLLEMAQSQSSPESQPGDSEEEGDPSEEESEPQDGESQDQPPDPDGEQPPQDQPEQEPQPEESEDGEESDEGESEEPEDPEEPPVAPPDSTDAPQPAAADSLLALPEGMTPEDALRLLDALDHDEEELRRSIQRRLRGTDTRSSKDW